MGYGRILKAAAEEYLDLLDETPELSDNILVTWSDLEHRGYPVVTAGICVGNGYTLIAVPVSRLKKKSTKYWIDRMREMKFQIIHPMDWAVMMGDMEFVDGFRMIDDEDMVNLLRQHLSPIGQGAVGTIYYLSTIFARPSPKAAALFKEE